MPEQQGPRNRTGGDEKQRTNQANKAAMREQFEALEGLIAGKNTGELSDQEWHEACGRVLDLGILSQDVREYESGNSSE